MAQQTRGYSPLTAKLYELDHPRSLGVYSTYAEVQAVVDTLADHDFPVQRTMIVGTDLKLLERVTGRRSWGSVIGSGILSGIWMGLFLGLLFVLLTDAPFIMVLTSILMGVVFFTTWSVIGYAATGGRRDFTSMTATVPMQYELMVEHTDVEAARRILIDTGAITPPPAPAPARFEQPRSDRPSYGLPGPRPETEQTTQGRSRPSYGQSAPAEHDAAGSPGTDRSDMPGVSRASADGIEDPRDR